MFTLSPVIHPLTRKSTRPSPIAWRWILQVTVNVPSGHRCCACFFRLQSVLPFRNSLKTNRVESSVYAVPAQSVNFTNFTKSTILMAILLNISAEFELEFVDFQDLDAAVKS